MRAARLYHSIRLLLCRSARKRADYIRKHNLFDHMGENVKWGPWLLPLHAKLIRVHDNVVVHKSAHLSPHDMINNFLKGCDPDADFGYREKLGCIELMDNVYISMNVIIMPNVRINRNCIISAGSVVASDIPENSIASGIPAKPTGRFDMFMALRKMSKNQTVAFKKQQMPPEVAAAEWERFDQRHGS